MSTYPGAGVELGRTRGSRKVLWPMYSRTPARMSGRESPSGRLPHPGQPAPWRRGGCQPLTQQLPGRCRALDPQELFPAGSTSQALGRQGHTGPEGSPAGSLMGDGRAVARPGAIRVVAGYEADGKPGTAASPGPPGGETGGTAVHIAPDLRSAARAPRAAAARVKSPRVSARCGDTALAKSGNTQSPSSRRPTRAPRSRLPVAAESTRIPKRRHPWAGQGPTCSFTSARWGRPGRRWGSAPSGQCS